VYTHLNAEMEPRENNHHKNMVFYINVMDVEFGIKLNEKEVECFGAGMASMISDGSFFEFVEQFKSAFENKADDQEEEKSEEPKEEATDEEKLRDEYVSKLRDLGFKVEVEDEKKEDTDSDPYCIQCRTYGTDSGRMKIVKDYLRKNGINAVKGISLTGKDEIDYFLWPHQVKELTDLIDQDERTCCDGKIII